MVGVDNFCEKEYTVFNRHRSVEEHMKKFPTKRREKSFMAAVKKATVKPVAKVAEAAVKTIAPKAEEKKTEEKKVEAVVAAPAKAEAVKPVEKKEEAPKAAAKKAPAKKAASKAAEKKAPAKKAELKSELHVQFAGKSYSQEDLVKIAKDVWKYDLKQKVGDLTSVELYVKPEESMVYYVMNKEFTGSFFI